MMSAAVKRKEESERSSRLKVGEKPIRLRTVRGAGQMVKYPINRRRGRAGLAEEAISKFDLKFLTRDLSDCALELPILLVVLPDNKIAVHHPQRRR